MINQLKNKVKNLSKLSDVKNVVVKNTVYDEFVKKVNAIDLNKQNIEKRIEDVNKKIPDTSKFIETHKFNRLPKVDFHARKEEASKNLATERQIENVLDLGDKKREKKNNFKH